LQIAHGILEDGGRSRDGAALDELIDKPHEDCGIRQRQAIGGVLAKHGQASSLIAIVSFPASTLRPF
jgi:hypothetical protein